jgi:hypothetical protein
MAHHQIHFEVFARRAGGASFNLELATEDREKALEIAEEMLEGPRFVAVRVTKETMDPETGEFQSVTILSKGAASKPKSKTIVEDAGAPCVSPADLYTVHARDKIGRLLEGWLARNRATPFELLHRPDLIERLDAAGVELQHAVQKIAVPESQARGVGVHEVIRGFQQLIQRAIERVLGDQKRGVFPDLAQENFAEACQRLSGEPERHYLLGVGIASQIGKASTWSEKVGILLDLAESAPQEGPGRGLAFITIEQPLSEILRSRLGMADLVGGDLDLGGNLAALTRLAAAETVGAIAKADAVVARLIPELSGQAERLGVWLQRPAFQDVRLALGKRVLQELTTLRRLRPSDPKGEIDIMRALAMALTAASGPLLPLEEVREAFIKRSETLVASDFIEAYLRDDRTAVQEAHDLVWLLENVTGGSNKRQAVRWLMSTICSLKFETEMASSAESPAAHLTRLSELYRLVARAGGDAAPVAEVLTRIGEIGGRIEAEARLTSVLARAEAPMPQKMRVLLRMAVAETAPPGPAADRARVEVLRLMKGQEGRASLAAMPDMVDQVRTLMQTLEAAA